MDEGIKRHDNVYQYVGARLKQLRHQHNMTQAQVSVLVGVSPQQYQKYEDASSRCSLTTLRKLAKHYGIPMDSMLPVDRATMTTLDSVPIEVDLIAARENSIVQNDGDLVIRLINNFLAIKDPQLRKAVVDLVDAMRLSAVV